MTKTKTISPPQTAPPLWDQQARHWSLVEPPLHPAAPDLQYAQHAIDQSARLSPLNAFILGVTPELAALRWPAAARITAIDNSPAMIHTHWPKNSPQHFALQADWLHLPLPDKIANLILGDGCYVLLNAKDAITFTHSIARILSPAALFSIRVFTRPELPESPDDICADLLAQKIPNFAIFKFRLLASLADPHGNVPVATAWNFFHHRFPSIPKLAAQINWREDIITTIRAYRDQPSIYWYPTIDRFRTLISHSFQEISCQHPTYPFGDRCPTFLLRPRVN